MIIARKKKNEREMSREEAVELATYELKGFWHRSKPLFAAVRMGERTTVFPLGDDFSKKPYFIFFCDLTELSGVDALTIYLEFYRRYRLHGLEFLMIIRPRFQYLLDPKWIDLYIRRKYIPFPVVIDHDGLIHEAFGAKEMPAIYLASGGKFYVKRMGVDWIKGTELELQNFLRSTDLGLPLLPVKTEFGILHRNTVSYDLGSKGGVKFEPKTFVRTLVKTVSKTKKKTDKRAAELEAAELKRLQEVPLELSSLEKRPAQLKEGVIFLGGTWLQETDRLVTKDPQAFIAFRSPTPGLSVIAQSLGLPEMTCKMSFALDGVSINDQFKGDDLVFDEEGRSILKLEGVRTYHPLRKLPATHRELTLRFPTANRAPVAVYALRFFELG